MKNVLLENTMKLTILGSTGSIGQNTLDVIRHNPAEFEVVALTAKTNIELLYQQCIEFKPSYAVVLDQSKAQILTARLQQVGIATEVHAEASALETVASLPEVDTVMAAIVGAAGLLPTLAAARSGKRILLANKEALVMAGELFMNTVAKNKAQLLPVDSEHNAIFQCLPVDYHCHQTAGIKKIILTASGGAVRDLPLTQLRHVTPAQACQHPNWSMGQKVTLDSATMMNKALEVIEAHWLFNIPPTQIAAVLHLQSTVHSLVEYQDGSMLAQLGCPDMRIPIANCLAWPKRIRSGSNFLDLLTLKRLDFSEMCTQRYPAFQLGYESLRMGGTATTVLNAANEESVAAFLKGQIRFSDIADINAELLAEIPVQPMDSLETVLEIDRLTRIRAQRFFKREIRKITSSP